MIVLAVAETVISDKVRVSRGSALGSAMDRRLTWRGLPGVATSNEYNQAWALPGSGTSRHWSYIDTVWMVLPTLRAAPSKRRPSMSRVSSRRGWAGSLTSMACSCETWCCSNCRVPAVWVR